MYLQGPDSIGSIDSRTGDLAIWLFNLERLKSVRMRLQPRCKGCHRCLVDWTVMLHVAFELKFACF